MSYNVSDRGPFCVALDDTPEHFTTNDVLDVVKEFNPQSAISVEGNKWIVSLKTRIDAEKAIHAGQVAFLNEEEECTVLITSCEPDEILEVLKEIEREDDKLGDQGNGQATTMPDPDEKVEFRTGPPSMQTSAYSDPITTGMQTRNYPYQANPMNMQHGNYPAMQQHYFGYEQPTMDPRGMNTNPQKNENPVQQFQQSAHYGFQHQLPSLMPPGTGLAWSQHPHQLPDNFYGAPGQQPFPLHGHSPFFAPPYPGYPLNYPGSPYQQGGSYYQPYNQASAVDQSQKPNHEPVNPSQSAARSKHEDNADEVQLKNESVLKELPYVQHQKKQDTSSTGKDDEQKQYKEEEHLLTAVSRKLKVANVPHGVSDDALKMFFEHEKRSGGGEIKHLDFDADSSTAIIEFEDPSVIDRVLQRLPLVIQGKQLKIEVYKQVDEKVVEDKDEINDLPKTTVEVRGFSKDTSTDALEMYFENMKRSGGGPINNIEWKDKVALITFESEAATSAVLQRSHKLSGMDLDVKLYVPPKPVPMYLDKVLITGLNEKITEDCLTNFLEARGGVSPTEILYAEDDEQKALVTFESPPDLKKLQDACQKKKLEGAMLAVSQVPISKCVRATNLAPKTSEDMVHLYFENTKRSGGGPVEKVEMNEQEGACLIYFEDLNVIDSVLRRKHKLDNSEIQLQLFHPCISRTTSAENRGKFQTPESFVYKVSVQIIAFLRQVPDAKVWLEQEMSKVHGRVVVSSDDLNTLEVFPMLTVEMKGVKNLVKTWKETAGQKLEESIKQLDCMEHQIMSDLWVSTLANLEKIQIPNEKDVIVCTDQQHSIIRVVGFKDMVDHVSHNLKQIIFDGEKELKLKKQRTSDRKILLKQEIYFLLSVNFPDKVHTKFGEVKCTIQQKDDIIVFEGLLLDIKQAQVLMYETIQTIKKSSIPDYSRSKLELLALKETCDYLKQKLEEKGCLGVWKIEGSSLIVFDESDQKADEGTQIIRKCLVENTINLTPEQRPVINSDAWKAMLADINRQHQGHTIIHVQNSTIEITATDQYAGKIIEIVQDFISANALYKQTVTVDPRKVRYLEQWKKPQIDEICKSQQNNMVTIGLSQGVITLQGTKKGLHEAESKMSTLLKQMCCKQTSLEKPGICKYLCSDKGEELIKHIEYVNKCTIDLTNQEDDTDQTSLEETQLELQKHLQHPVECLSCRMLGGRIMSVFHGDITDLDIHILINPCNNTLDHSAGLAKAVVEKGNLKCKTVAHGVVPVWQKGTENEEVYLREVVLKSLEETDKRKLTSIGIPAIGTGIFSWPVSVATLVIIKAVQEYFQDHSKSVVKNVCLCDLDAQQVKSFIDAVMIVFPKDDLTFHEDPSQTAAKGTSSLGRSSGYFGYEKGASQPHVLRADGMKVFIHICADSEIVIQAAVDGLETKFNKELETDVIKDEVIIRLSEEKVSEIEKIGRKYNVMIRVEKRVGHVRIEGLFTDVAKVKTEVLNMIRSIEKMENREKQAAMLSQLVQWYYIEITDKGQDLVEYATDINATIEDAYQQKEKKLKLQTDVGPIIIDFDALEEYPLRNPSDKVTVLRKDKIKDSVSKIPLQWDSMDKDNLRLIPLPPASKEYTDVASRFMATVKKENTTATVPIVKIERIQNKTLYAQYQSKKKLIDEMNPGKTNEMDLWHGTAKQAVDSINVYGFNRSFCGKNATLYGDGVYFAKEAYYSARDLFSPLDPAGNKRMYFTKVLTGKYAKGAQGMRVPPPLVSDRPVLHDCVVDDVNNPLIFVIFHDTQAYPEYLITFKWN